MSKPTLRLNASRGVTKAARGKVKSWYDTHAVVDRREADFAAGRRSALREAANVARRLCLLGQKINETNKHKIDTSLVQQVYLGIRRIRP